MEHETMREAYARLRKRRVLFTSALILVLFVLIGIAITLGSADLSIQDSYKAIIEGICPGSADVSDLTMVIVWQLRLHRVLFAVVAGFGLAVAGTIMQGILRNPLASPFTLGIASAAACGASVAIVLGAGIGSGEFLVVANAFVFALLAAGGIYLLARSRGMNAGTMILAGIALMYLFSAVTSLLQYIGTAEQLQEVVFWMFGSLDKSSWLKLGIVSTVLIITVPYLLLKAWDLNALAEGDEVATSLGIPVERSMTVMTLISALLTASIISFTGTIGFIGLVAPHITRMAIGGDHRVLLPASGLVGAILLLAADSVARSLLAPTVLPVGIMTAFLGVPFFLYLFLRREGSGW